MRDKSADKRVRIWDHLRDVREQLRVAVVKKDAARLGREELLLRMELSATAVAFREASHEWNRATTAFYAVESQWEQALAEYLKAQSEHDIAQCDSVGWRGALPEEIVAIAATAAD